MQRMEKKMEEDTEKGKENGGSDKENGKEDGGRNAESGKD